MSKTINCLVDHKGAPCTCDMSMYENLNKPMSTTTQNDWAERFDKEFPNLRMYYSDGLAPCEDDVKAFIAKELADARKEGHEQRIFTIDSLKKTCKHCGVVKETAFHKDASQSHDGCENNYNKAIDDVLATLRKEQG